jgi:hypothetical protein
MNSQDYRNIREAYLNVYEQEELLDEISQKTATRAFAQRATNEFETDQTSKKSDATKSRIEKKFGKKAGAHAERAAHANIFGRKSSSMPKESYDLYDIILSHLIDEGYDLSDYTWDELYEHYNQLDEVSDRKVRAVRNAREKQWNKQFGKNRVQDPTDDMVDRVDKLIDQRNKRTGSKVKKTTMGQLRDKYRKRKTWRTNRPL